MVGLWWRAGTVVDMLLVVLVLGIGFILDVMVEVGLLVFLVVLDCFCFVVEKVTGHDVEVVVVCWDIFGDDFDCDGYMLFLIDLLEEWDVTLVVMVGFGIILG